MDTGSQVYRDLQKHLDKLAIGFPPTESGVEIRILKHLFTPEEAKLATQLSMIPESVNRIYKRVKKTGISIEELEKALYRMAGKGAILAGMKAGEKLYSVIQLVFGMYEFQIERLTKDFAQDFNQYIEGEFGNELYRTKIPQLRTIPVEKSIPAPDKYKISTYDDVREVIKNVVGQIAVINCICRQNKDLIGGKCATTDLRETCLVFREAAEGCIKGGIARSISKEEALAILGKAQEAGLVLQPENTQRPLYVCCCCGDCCGILTTVKRYPRPAELYATNHYAEINPELCTGCEICIKHCQLDAITIVDSVATVNRDRCIGCGNCVAICEFNASQLRKKEEELVPPENTDALYRKILSKKVGKLNMLKIGTRIALRLKV